MNEKRREKQYIIKKMFKKNCWGAICEGEKFSLKLLT